MKNLKLLRLIVILLAVVVYLCGEQGWLPNGLLAGEAHRQGAYLLHAVVILLTLATAPLAYHLRDKGTGWAVDSVRWAQAICALLGIVAYHLTLSSTGLLCAAITLIIFFHTTAQRT